MWSIDQIEINGGFLPGFKMALPKGLICIIGPRGSGKSTLAESFRLAIKGATGASKQRLDLLQANFGNTGLVTLVASADSGATYTIKRAFKQPAVLLSADGKSIQNVDLDRGKFLPLDAYNSLEIEEIAREVLGDKRRSLLDDLRGEELSRINLSLGEQRRALDANADFIKAARRAASDLSEQVEEIGDVRAKLGALGTLSEAGPSTEYTKAVKQQQRNGRERKRLDGAIDALRASQRDLQSLSTKLSDRKTFSLVEDDSSNSSILQIRQMELNNLLDAVRAKAESLGDGLAGATGLVERFRSEITDTHSSQAAVLTQLQQVHQAADEQYQFRLELEQRVSKLQETEIDLAARKEELRRLLNERKSLKAKYLLEREQMSSLRDSIAADLQAETGKRVRLRIIRNADDLTYRSLLTDGLKGAGVRYHEEILQGLLQLRPEQLAQFIQTDDHVALDEACGFGSERARKILDAFRENVDPLQLEVVDIQDQVRIELNVATEKEPLFKDAADLSSGQKCTALLPLLLARTKNPLVIDQPEDNLDNHFIYETVVNSIQRLKRQRQMIFITHNANIPVLAEADLVIVMNSDGKIGYVEKSGSVDECRDQIVDLLEGGKEAFELRRERYART